MFPVIEANRNRAPHGGAAQAPGSTKSVALPFATVPVGSPPGIVMNGIAETGTSGLPLTSPVNRVEVLVPLLATQNGLAAVALMPQGLTRSGF
jgi:hypothetical protein